jgi:hypothetical protein
LEPLLVETQNASRLGERALLAYLVEHVDEPSELRGKLEVDFRRIAGAETSGASVGITSHAHIVVETDPPSSDAIRKEAGNEQRQITRDLQERESSSSLALKRVAENLGKSLIFVELGSHIKIVAAHKVIEKLHQIKGAGRG